MLHVIRVAVRRARQERLPQLAGSLTFTTVLSIVPLMAVSFALFARFPVLLRFEQAIEEHLLRSLLPQGLSRTVLTNLHRFAENAGALTMVGLLVTLASAIALLLTVENALNRIWQVRRKRPLPKRVGLYALMLTIGPPIAGVSLWATAYVLSASIDLIGPLPPTVAFALTLGPLLLSALALAALFYFVPNTGVRLRDALAGGVLAGGLLELGRRGFAAYVVTIPTYKAVYGALAALPMFLLWLYFSWFVTLAAALVTANLARARQRGAARSSRAPPAG